MANEKRLIDATAEKGKKMPKYIERDAFIAWLKKIPLEDLSDGRGLCRVIMEDDFKRAIKNMPESIIHESEVEVVRCKDCRNGKRGVDNIVQCNHHSGKRIMMTAYGFCSYGVKAVELD